MPSRDAKGSFAGVAGFAELFLAVALLRFRRTVAVS